MLCPESIFSAALRRLPGADGAGKFGRGHCALIRGFCLGDWLRFFHMQADRLADQLLEALDHLVQAKILADTLSAAPAHLSA